MSHNPHKSDTVRNPSDISESEKDAIIDYLENGGKAMIFSDYTEEDMENIISENVENNVGNQEDIEALEEVTEDLNINNESDISNDEAQKKKEIYSGIIDTINKVIHDNERLILRLDSLAYALNQRSAQNPWDTDVVLAMSKLDSVISKTANDIKQDEEISKEVMRRFDALK